MTSTVIIGNGIGMALDPGYFALASGLMAAAERLDNREREIIEAVIGRIPRNEAELDENYYALLNACRTLMEMNRREWLARDGADFPEAYQNFLYYTARHFFDYDETNLAHEARVRFYGFLDSICNFIKGSTCHLATLNYDKLLYGYFLDERIKLCDGYNGKLVDGFHVKASGINKEHLMRKYDKKFGWYMHLHGSPAFYTKNDQSLNKMKLDKLPETACEAEGVYNHIVLSHTNFKPDIIARSKLLGIYFDYFIKALNESERIYLIGYSGEDDHVNDEIQLWISNGFENRLPISIHIVEWNPEELRNNERYDFWVKKLTPKTYVDTNNSNIEFSKFIRKLINYHPHQNILDYRFE